MLVDGRFPQWRSLPVRRVESEGTVNPIFRIGDGPAARLPLQPGVERGHLEAEAAATRELAAATAVPVPEPVALGEPGHGYPRRREWAAARWPGCSVSPGRAA